VPRFLPLTIKVATAGASAADPALPDEPVQTAGQANAHQRDSMTAAPHPRPARTMNPVGPAGCAASQSAHRLAAHAGGLGIVSSVVWYGFVYYDDVRILQDHPELYGQANLSADLQAIFVTCFPREEPLLLRDVTWALDSRVFGFGNAFGYHLGNVLLHGIVVALMFAFLLGTTRRYGFALAVSTAYLVLAIHTEPVVWIMGRKDILSALFMLLALCAQTRRLTTERGPARSGWYVATLAFVSCAGCLSKISVLTFPLVLFLHAIFLPYLRMAPVRPTRHFAGDAQCDERNCAARARSRS
jgi:hypothetical protein